MKRNLFITVLMFGWSLQFASCGKMAHVHCTPSQSYAMNIFIGFDSNDIRTLTLVKYSNNGLFNNLIDTYTSNLIYNQYSYTDSFPAYNFHDTIYASGLSGQNDWIVKAAPIGKEWRVSNIQYEDLIHIERPSSDHVNDIFSCPLASYTIDGHPVEGTTSFYFTR